MNILLLGAGKRVSLIERFNAAAFFESVPLNWFSVEASKDVPIGQMPCRPKILVGPKFEDASFRGYLNGAIQAANIDIVIPLMDTATVALSNQVDALKHLGVLPVVSASRLCHVFADKALSEAWFHEHGVPTPRSFYQDSLDPYPKIIKHRAGFGSRDQQIVYYPSQESAFFRSRYANDYIIQEFISGTEYSVDAYVDQSGEILGIFTRVRRVVESGEVMVSEAKHHPEIEQITRDILMSGGFYGPITLQFMDADRPYLLEINPRFGGGVIHAIHAGLDMPRWILRERLNIQNRGYTDWQEGTVMSRYRTEVFL